VIPESIHHLTVKVQSFCDLFEESAPPLALDTYQRPYVWGPDKVDQLINDLTEYTAHCYKANHYYMGTVLLHDNREKKRFFIIDGQQRLLSLSVLYYVLAGDLPTRCELSFRPESEKNIKQAQRRFDRCDLRLHGVGLFDRICFTVVTVPSEDLAFNFFDTQNNRGVPLNATDILKAYHLRAITGNDRKSERLQTSCAERWERLQGTASILGHTTDFAPVLFDQFLWRARRWTGQQKIYRQSRDDIIEEFQAEDYRKHPAA
jgi:hypothetical protein